MTCGISFRFDHFSHLFSKCFLHLFVILLLCLPTDEALRLLERARCQSRLILAETHPLQGELDDAMARAYATMGEKNSLI